MVLYSTIDERIHIGTLLKTLEGFGNGKSADSLFAKFHVKAYFSLIHEEQSILLRVYTMLYQRDTGFDPSNLYQALTWIVSNSNTQLTPQETDLIQRLKTKMDELQKPLHVYINNKQPVLPAGYNWRQISVHLAEFKIDLQELYSHLVTDESILVSEKPREHSILGDVWGKLRKK